MAVPSSLARRYAPFLILAGVQVLLVAVVPSTGGPNGGNTVAAGPGASNNDDYIPGESFNPDGTPVDPNAPGGAGSGPGGAGGPGGTTAGGPGGGAGGPGGGAGGGGRAGLTTDKSKCAKDGIRQQDVTITSPPCVPRWTGPNGGATYRGVTEKTITVLHYRTQADPQVDAILQTQGLASSPAEEEHARNAFGKFFEKHYEFYGRTIDWRFHQGTCRTTPPDLPCYRREAKELHDTVKPFAVFWTNSTVQAEFFDQWSEMGVINIGGWHFHNDFFTQNRPYHWDVFMDGTRTTQNLAEYWCKKLQGKNAKFAGDPTIQAKRRVVGVVTQDFEYTRRNAHDFVKAVRGGMCGEPADAVEPYFTQSDITRGQEIAFSAMKKLKEDGATTVVFLSDPIGPRFFTNAATAQGWYPEHLLSGAGLIDYDVLGRLYEQSQWVNAFGPGHLAEPIPFHQTDAARAAADVGVNNVYSGANLLFAYMHLAVLQVQMAGPNLNPTNVERGIHALPPGGGWERTKNPASVLVKFGPGDYTAIHDSRHTWWDPQATSKIDGKQGAYRAVQGGRRWEIGTWGPEELVKQ